MQYRKCRSRDFPDIFSSVLHVTRPTEYSYRRVCVHTEINTYLSDICIHACVYACPYAYEYLVGRPSRSFNEHAESVVRAKWRTDVLLRRFSPPLRNGRRSSAKKRKIEGKTAAPLFLARRSEASAGLRKEPWSASERLPREVLCF